MISAFIILIICAASSAREINHEDIRDAILSLINMFRGNTDKLERHELRERQLGEQLKKALVGLDKRQESSVSAMTSSFNSLETRLQYLENVITTKSPAESSQDLKSLMSNVEEMLKRTEGRVRTESETDNTNSQRIDELSAKVDRMEGILIRLEEAINRNPISHTEVEVAPLNNGKYTYTTSDLESRLDEQTQLLQSISTKLDSGISLNDLNTMTNNTQTLVQEIKYELMETTERSVMKLEDHMKSIGEQVKNDRQQLVKSIIEISERTEELYGDIQRSYDQLLKEVKGLVKVEEVLIQTADNVLDTKRRIEYGVHQILLEVGDLIKTQSKELNATVNSRFDVISQTILDNQNGGLTNLSTKIETEISQVWRQIGIMYQTLTSSAQALDRLQVQTETYVNGSLSTMGNMAGKVAQITGRMSEVDENLNYLLGKLSLVTHEFNEIKSGLGEALDNIRTSFLTVQKKVKEVEDLGPGPNPIEGDIVDENTLSKSRYSTS